MTSRKSVSIACFNTKEEGIRFAKETIYKEVNLQTLLLLSGGNTPKPFYQQLAQEGKLHCGGVCIVDERYGKPYHDNSNEKMIEGTGLIGYLNGVNIPFYNILENKSMVQTASDYEKLLAFLYGQFAHRVAIMGIGKDGHIAGIPAKSQISRFAARRANLKSRKGQLAVYFEDFPGESKDRITLTFKALEQINKHIILAFGEDKKKAMLKMFEEGSEEDIPARFYLREDIAKKTLLITDQKI